MITDKEGINNNQDWFNGYIDKIEKATGQKHKKFGDFFLCPCCGYPTLTKRVAWDICILCFWEDDGQDDPHANEVWGGPNSNYSLTEARENFRRYYTMYRPSDERAFNNGRVKKSSSGKILLDKVALKVSIIEKYQQLFNATDEKQKQNLWQEIEKLEKKL